MIKSIIIDDEPLARLIIREYLSEQKDIEVVAECNDGFEGIKAIQEHNPELIFLDIQMPKLSGLEMLEVLDEPPHIIFTTAFDEYAIKAFEKNAVDYLLKPISKERFATAIDKIRNIQDRDVDYKNILTTANLLPNEKLERIVVKHGTQIKIIPIHKVHFLEAYDDYVKIHTEDGMFLKNKTMKSFEEELDSSQFVRVHRSYIVKIDQLEKIEPYEKESFMGTLISGDKVNISKSGYAKLKQVIGM